MQFSDEDAILVKEIERTTREAAERQQKLRDAEAEFNKEVAPRLAELAPFTTIYVRPPRGGAPETPLFLAPEAKSLFVLAGTKRSPERVAAAKVQLEALKATAEMVVQLTTREPIGVETFDQPRDRARAFAAARARSFAQLLTKLDTTGPPNAETWAAWQAARRDADHAWAALVAK